MYLQADTVRHRKGHFLGKDDSRDSALPIYSTVHSIIYLYSTRQQQVEVSQYNP